MTLDRLYASGFRNLAQTDVELNKGINLFYGDNGSGKTSVLEAVYFLGTSRSFRTAFNDTIIQQGSKACLVRGEVAHQGKMCQVGVSRSRLGKREVSLNGDRCRRSSEIARLLPMLVLSPESIELLNGPPSVRRRFINWGVFHVEQGFPALWDEGNRCLKQRNILLREGKFSGRVFKTWSAELAERAEKIDAARESYLNRYKPIFQAILARISRLSGVDMHYYRGWQKGLDLNTAYEELAEKDLKRGFTQLGFQRADVRLTIDDQPVSEVCSRGELKALAWSMILAQGAAQEDSNNLYLIDDLSSEFDFEHRRRIGSYLAESSKQVFITGVDQRSLVTCCEGTSSRMFHVKHGQVDHLDD